MKSIICGFAFKANLEDFRNTGVFGILQINIKKKLFYIFLIL